MVGSRAELAELDRRSRCTSIDPHRPYVDDVAVPCRECGEPARRVPEVVDGWFDSGCMPFAQWGYPHQQSEDEFRAQYPADYICEAIDQTRGWFYTLMTVGTLVFDESSYRTVLCLGHILDKDGRKMSKHLGNVLEPMPLMERHGADAVRWFMVASGSPWSAQEGQPRDDPGGRPQDAADVLEHRLVPGALCPARRLEPPGGRGPGRRPPGDGPLARLAHPAADPRCRLPHSTGSTPQEPAGRSPPSSTSSPTGTSARSRRTVLGRRRRRAHHACTRR